MKYSFVIPCYNSSKTIESVVIEIRNKMIELKEKSYEIILVNDYSPDNTKEVIFNLSDKYNNIISINFSKNFGQHAALLAGYSKAKGEYVVSLDDDGQTPANQVDRLINKLNEGFDVVFANYKHKHHSTFRNFGSKVNDFMAEKLINKPKGLYLSSYFIARRYVIDELLNYNSAFPYVSGLLLRTTANVVNVDVDHRDRNIGNSGYTFIKLLKLWLNGFTAFSIKPLRISVYIGVLVAIIGFILTMYSILNKILNPNVPMGWTSVVAIISLVGGTTLMVLGMIGEYIGRIYMTLNKTPQYVIKEIKGEKNA